MLHSTKTQTMLLEFMQHHKLSLVIDKPTTHAGSLLDHFWIRNIDIALVNLTVLDTYWTDHFAISLQLQL